MLRLLIAEDERDAAEHLTDLLRRYEKAHGLEFDIVIRGSSLDLFADKRHYDICFFDIDLPGISGMEAAQLMRSYDSETAIVFVTNLAKFAVRGYEVGAAGFIVKPATYSSLSLCLGRAIKIASSAARRSIMIPVDENCYVLSVNELEYAEIRGHDLIFHAAGKEPLKTRGSLVKLQGDLAEAPFSPASRSVLVNLDFIARICGDDAVLTSGEKIHLSRGRKRPLMEALARHLGEGA